MSWQPAKKSFLIHAYKVVPCTCQDGIICTLPQISNALTAFLTEHAIANAFISLSTAGSLCQQEIRTCSQATPEACELHDTMHKTGHYICKHVYLYPTNNGSFAFYVSRLPQSLISHYMLLAHGTQLNLIQITPHQATYLSVYTFLHKQHFSYSKLANDLQAAGSLERLITTEQLASLITYNGPKIGLEKEIPYLANALGLYISGAHL